MFHGGDEHAVWRQLATLAYHDAFFRCLRLATKRVTLQGRASILSNFDLWSFLSVNHVHAQAMRVRRLCEPRHRDARRQVISLGRIIDELEHARPTLTRDYFVRRGGVPYDWNEGREAHARFLRDRARGEEETDVDWGGPADHGFPDYETSADRQRLFDQLSGVAGGCRKPGDLIDPAWTEHLRGQLQHGSRRIKLVADKVVAHAADATSRGEIAAPLSPLSLREFDRASMAVAGVASVLSEDLFGKSLGRFVPRMRRDVLDHFQHAGLAEQEVERLRRVWDAVGQRWKRRAGEAAAALRCSGPGRLDWSDPNASR